MYKSLLLLIFFADNDMPMTLGFVTDVNNGILDLVKSDYPLMPANGRRISV